MKQFFTNLKPATRLALGLMSLFVTLLLLVNITLNLVPDKGETERRIRASTSERLAVQIASLIQTEQRDALKRVLSESLARDPDILSVAVRPAGGRITFQAGDHSHLWTPPASGRSTLTHVRVPIIAQNAQWGDVEITYKPVTPQDLKGWLQVPLVTLALVVAPVGFLVCYLYLRRALQYLDPASAVPDRVRLAFDLLAEGVVVVDRAGQIVLSNKAFSGMHPDASVDLMGKRLSALPWLMAKETTSESAWQKAMRTLMVASSHHIDITQPDNSISKVTVNAAPILDNASKLRGCIVTFNDLTELHRVNQQLTHNLVQLSELNAQVEQKSEELRVLATRDSMTGLLNRRAFISAAQSVLEKGLREAHSVSFIMADIDFFKRVNDTYGHLVGDQVIVAFSRTISAQVRNVDLLCRYGGEEFCIVLPDTPEETALQVAERVRDQVGKHVGDGIRTVDGLQVTCSLGVASLKSRDDTLLGLIERADQALYYSKRNGRDQVTLWSDALNSSLEDAKKA